MSRFAALAPLSALAALALVLAVPAAGDEITTLDGRRLAVPEPGEDFRATQETHLAAARMALAENDDDPEAWIWTGRRLAYLGRYVEALEIFDQGVERFPSDARFRRHRGHRYISLRRLDEAIADFSHAARLVAGTPDPVEPDGLPNARRIPTSTLKTNIWYHLGLAHYLQGDFDAALEAYQRCSALAANPDMLVAAEYWRYLSLRRTARNHEAAALLEALPMDLELVENDGYYELLKVFAAGEGVTTLLASVEADKGVVAFPTTAYGLAIWTQLEGDIERAEGLYSQILASSAITAFGYIAAEAELARLKP